MKNAAVWDLCRNKDNKRNRASKKRKKSDRDAKKREIFKRGEKILATEWLIIPFLSLDLKTLYQERTGLLSRFDKKGKPSHRTGLGKCPRPVAEAGIDPAPPLECYSGSLLPAWLIQFLNCCLIKMLFSFPDCRQKTLDSINFIVPLIFFKS